MKETPCGNENGDLGISAKRLKNLHALRNTRVKRFDRHIFFRVTWQ